MLSDTTYSRVDARWTSSDGGSYYFWISAPAKEPVHESGALAIAGYIGDGELLDVERRKFLADKSLSWRVRRAFRNVQLLWLHNDPWPEDELTRPPPRHELQKGFNAALRHVVLPLAAVGLFTARRRAALAIVFAHLLTLIGLAMFFFPEARYRVPYDPMLLLLALAGVLGMVDLVRQKVNAASAARSGGSL